MNWFKRNKPKKLDNKSDFVRVVDIETNEITEIPARELAPHMVEARMEGIDGTVWLDARELKQSEYRHPPFSEEVRDAFREIKSSIDEFYNLSLEEWEDGFRRDTNPDREIAIWLHMARVYHQLTTQRDLSPQQRQDYFHLLLTCLNSPREHVLHVYAPAAISREEATNVIVHFYGEGH